MRGGKGRLFEGEVEWDRKDVRSGEEIRGGRRRGPGPLWV